MNTDLKELVQYDISLLEDIIDSLSLNKQDIMLKLKREKSQMKESGMVLAALLKTLEFIFDVIDEKISIEFITQKFPMATSLQAIYSKNNPFA